MKSGKISAEGIKWRVTLLGLQSNNEDKKTIKILYFPAWFNTELHFCSLIFPSPTQRTTQSLSFPRDWQVLYLPRCFLSARLQNHGSPGSGLALLSTQKYRQVFSAYNSFI